MLKKQYPLLDVTYYVDLTLRERWEVLYPAALAKLTVPPSIALWVLAMTERHGEWIYCDHNVADWLTALLILRYGEEPRAEYCVTADGQSTGDGWPTSFSGDDITAARKILAGEKWPARFRFITHTTAQQAALDALGATED
jgi:hypothetical protein